MQAQPIITRWVLVCARCGKRIEAPTKGGVERIAWMSGWASIRWRDAEGIEHSEVLCDRCRVEVLPE